MDFSRDYSKINDPNPYNEETAARIKGIVDQWRLRIQKLKQEVAAGTRTWPAVLADAKKLKDGGILTPDMYKIYCSLVKEAIHE